MTCGRMLAFSVGCSALLCVASWPSTPAEHKCWSVASKERP